MAEARGLYKGFAASMRAVLVATRTPAGRDRTSASSACCGRRSGSPSRPDRRRRGLGRRRRPTEASARSSTWLRRLRRRRGAKQARRGQAARRRARDSSARPARVRRAGPLMHPRRERPTDDASEEFFAEDGEELMDRLEPAAVDQIGRGAGRRCRHDRRPPDSATGQEGCSAASPRSGRNCSTSRPTTR